MVTGSEVIQWVPDPATKLEPALLAGVTATWMETSPAAKLAQFLGVHWWRRRAGLDIFAASPGLVGGTRLTRYEPDVDLASMPGARTIAEGALSSALALSADVRPRQARRP
jgi:hypothetical protein